MRLCTTALAAAFVFASCVAIATPPTVSEFPSVNGPGGATGCTPGVGLECSDLSDAAYNFVYIDGYFSAADGGSGYFVKNGTGCTPNHGTILRDAASTPNCFYRASTNWNVREWGAHCDVAPAFNTGSFTGGSSTFNFGNANAQSSDVNKLIVIPQIGGGPYYPMSANTASPGSGYSAGQTLTFPGGVYSAPATILIDTVADGTRAVTAWHFLAYGAYTTPAGTPNGSGGGTTVIFPSSGASFSISTQWGGQTYSGAITAVSVPGHTLTVSPTPPYPNGITAKPNEWYYGSDDAGAINNAIASFSASGTPGLTIPANCGVRLLGNDDRDMIFAPTGCAGPRGEQYGPHPL